MTYILSINRNNPWLSQNFTNLHTAVLAGRARGQGTHTEHYTELYPTHLNTLHGWENLPGRQDRSIMVDSRILVK